MAGIIESVWLYLVKPTMYTNIVLPGLFLVGAMLFRWLFGRPFTVAADCLLAIIAFDMTAIASASEFKGFFRSRPLAEHFVVIHLTLLALSAMLWSLLVAKLEPRLDATRSSRSPYCAQSWIWSLIGIAISSIVIALHIFTYSAGG